MNQMATTSTRARGAPKGRSSYALRASSDQISLPRFKRLSAQHQAALILAAQHGSVTAMQAVWIRNARLVYTIANRSRVPADGVADAMQGALLRFPRIISRYNIARKMGFSTYAFISLFRAFSRTVNNTQYTTHIPEHLAKEYHLFRRSVLGAVTRAAWFDAREQYLERNPSLYARLVRLHALAEPADLVEAGSCAAPEPVRWRAAARINEFVHAAVALLPPRERIIIVRRYGLDGSPVATLDEIAVKLGRTRERIRQLQLKAEERLRGIIRRGHSHIEDGDEHPI